MTGRAFRSGLDLAHNAQARQTTDDGVPADLKKGPKRFRFAPFTALETAPQTSDAWASNALPASMLERRFGLLDCRLVIPGAANGNWAHARGSNLGRCVCLALATCADARATSCRELVDPCRSLIQTRIHHRLLASMRFNSACARLVLHWLPKAISSVHSASAT
jgi:hypothetical protein